MKKKVLSGIMAIILVIMTVSTVPIGEAYAAEAGKKEDTTGFQYESGDADISVKVMEMLGVINVNTSGSWGETKGVTRGEYAKMLVSLSSYAGKVSSNTNARIFVDVSPKNQYSGYIKLAVSKGWMSGYLGGKFKPEKLVTLEEAINGAVMLLGYKNEDFEGNISDAKYGLYLDKDLNSNISLKRSSSMKRKDCINLFYNLLKTKNKEGSLYGELFGYSLDVRGEIDYDKKVNESLKGPFFVNAKWEKSIPFQVSTKRLYKNNNKCGKSGIKAGDLIYYSITLKTVWAFDADSNIGYKALLDSTRKGPYLYGSSWKEKIPFSANSASIYKNDKKAAISDITNYDILYYSKEAKIIWAYDEKGEIDYLSILNQYKKGPYILKDSSLSNLPQSVQNARIYKNGKLSEKGRLEAYDVVYYSEELKTIWAYNNKIYGTYEEAKPNQVAPAEIVVGGVTYKIGSQALGYELSVQGSIREGMRVVLLLGDDGTVAGITPATDIQSVIAGYVIKTGIHMSKDSKGNADLINYIRIVDTSGTEQEYDTKLANFVVGDIVEINYVNGEAVVSKAVSGRLEGKVSSDGTSVSGRVITANANILDVAKGSYTKVSSNKLSGTELTSQNVLYYGVNKSGEITDMILLNATGDLFQYGILLSFTVMDQMNTGNGNIQLSGTYTYDLGGSKYTTEAQEISFNETAGPKGFLINNGEIKFLKTLYKVGVTSIERNQVRGGESVYPISDKAAVYVYSDNNYYPAKLSDISNLKKYNVEAYTDKINQEDGVIRVIVATKK